MRKARRIVLLMVILASLGGVVYKVADTVWHLEDLKRDPLKALEAIPQAALSMKDFHRAKIENGRKVWELFGDEANYLKEQKEAVIKKPRFYYYDKKGEVAKTSGDMAHLFFNQDQLESMHLEGAVHVTYQGYVLKSDEAVYLPAKEQIVMPRRTTVVGDGVEVEGSRMEVELEDQKVRLLRNVKTKIEPDKIERSEKRSDKMDLTEVR